MKPAVSVVVVVYNMAREIPRTVRSLSLAMQKGISSEDYEIILVDNGSTRPFDESECRRWIPEIRILRVEQPTSSPVAAINLGIASARGELVGVCIDGARIVSPGMLATARRAAMLHTRPVIGTLAFHLGPDLQNISMQNGYNQAIEDALLAGSGWEENGYRLFGISSFAGSSHDGWFRVPAESNAIFLAREHWEELGGYDPEFVSPGGGLANLDMWARACADPAGLTVMLLGEATFHQFHGGIATNSATSNWQTFHEEYMRLRGRPYAKPDVDPFFFGRLRPEITASLNASISAFPAQREFC